jgi:hypothetical protein
VPIDHILSLLIAERDRLNAAIDVLGGTTTKRRGRPPGSGVKHAEPAGTVRKKRNFSPAQRKAAADRMKAMWAKKRKATAKKTTNS